MRQVEVTIGRDIVAETVYPSTTVLQLAAAALQLALPAEPTAQVAANVDGQDFLPSSFPGLGGLSPDWVE